MVLNMRRHARNPELEAAIARAPDDIANYLVYSDWLTEQGDVRGELIALQRLNKKTEADALLKNNAHHFLGALADFDDIVTNIVWHLGFIKSATIANTSEREETADNAPEAVDEATRELLSHPSGAFLRELTIGILDFEGNDYSGFFKILSENPRPSLRKLYVGSFSSEETELNWSSIGITAPLWDAAPNLEVLTLRSGSMDLTGIHAENLSTLEIVTGGFDKKSLAALLAANWPKLETLGLQLGSETNFEITELNAIFDGAHFPALKHLGLTNSKISDGIAAAIVDSKIVKQLESLDLTLGTLGDEGTRALIDGKSRIQHLKRLDLSDNWISPAVCSQLKGLCLTVFDADQKDDEGERDNRYIAAYE